MNSIEINEHKFFYEIQYECSEVDTIEWTEFFLKTKVKKFKKYFFFGPIVEEIVADRKSLVFEVGFNIRSLKYTKSEVRNAIEHKIELWKRAEEIKRGEIV